MPHALAINHFAGDYRIRVGVRNTLVLPTTATTGIAAQRVGGVAGSKVGSASSTAGLTDNILWSDLSTDIVSVGAFWGLLLACA